MCFDVEIITIGDEILMGQVVNTNASYLGDRLTAAGISVGWLTSVGDDRERMLRAFGEAKSRAGAVIITGGLGPTPDDLTKPCLVEFFSDRMILRDDLLERVKKRFTDRGLEFPEASRGQAEFPDTAVEIPNFNGTAVGIHYSREGVEWFSLPGVPIEMGEMVENYVLPRLKETGFGEQVRVSILRTAGIGESSLLEGLTRFEEASELVEIAFLPRYYGVDLKLTARGDDPKALTDKISAAETLLLPDIAPFMYGRDRETLPEVLGRSARAGNFRIAVAESCTAGLIAKLITDVPGSSDYFDRGVVTYSNSAKEELLDVPLPLIEREGAVSAVVAGAMAEGLHRRSHCDLTVAVTGIAGPGGGSNEKPVGLVYIAIADSDGSRTEEFRFSGNRKMIRNRAAMAAINLLYDRIKKLDL
jgi:nicotinamide-nucleotide amidase